MKLRDASSWCILRPQFWDKAFANYTFAVSCHGPWVLFGPLTSNVYNCTLAFLWARRFIREATASLALSTIGQLASSPEVYAGTDPDSSAPTRSQTSYMIWVMSRKQQKIVHNIQTNMYSQFSEVRFSSVALAGCRSISDCSFSSGKLTNGVIKSILLCSKHDHNKRKKWAEIWGYIRWSKGKWSYVESESESQRCLIWEMRRHHLQV